jgi:LysM repeat protein
MPRIFISYRRADSAAPTERLYEQLAHTFGESSVFRDVHDIEAGEDFRARIEQEIISSDVMLVMIGRDWATIRSPDGTRRIDDPADFVRQEVEMGLRHQLEVIPVLVFGAKMPDPSRLPPGMYDLAFRNAASLRNPPHFDKDLQTLIKKLRRVRVRTGRTSRIPAVFFVLILIGVVAALVFARRPGEQTEAITFLLDQSEYMLEPVKYGERSRFELAQYVIASSINTELVMQENKTWVGLRTAGGGERGDCNRTSQLMSGTSERVNRMDFIRHLEGIYPGGNTAYVSGFSGAFDDLNQPETRNRDLKFVFLLLGAVQPSKDCRLLDSIDISRVMEEARQKDLTLILCALTFLDKDAFTRFIPRLESEGITCYDNATSQAEAKDMVQTVINTISAARQQERVDGPQQEETLDITRMPSSTASPSSTSTSAIEEQQGATESPVTQLDETTPLATARTSNPPPAGACIHVVAPGQSLSGIAQLYGKSVSQIMDINPIQNSNVVIAGQRLYIPPPCVIQPTAAKTGTNAVTPTPETQTAEPSPTETPDTATPTSTATPAPCSPETDYREFTLSDYGVLLTVSDCIANHPTGHEQFHYYRPPQEHPFWDPTTITLSVTCSGTGLDFIRIETQVPARTLVCNGGPVTMMLADWWVMPHFHFSAGAPADVKVDFTVQVMMEMDGESQSQSQSTDQKPTESPLLPTVEPSATFFAITETPPPPDEVEAAD